MTKFAILPTVMLLFVLQIIAIGQPTITGVSALSANPGVPVTISGSNFNSTPSNNIVRFGATTAVVTAASGTSLTATVPAGATFATVSVTNLATNLSGYSQYPFLPVYNNVDYLSGVVGLRNRVDYVSGDGVNCIVIHDMDGDGKPEMVVANQHDSTVSIHFNMVGTDTFNSSSFASRVSFFSGNSPVALAIGDIDGDGKPDIAAVNIQGNSMSIFRNTSTPGSITSASFASRVSIATGNLPRNIAIGDIDKDGKPDIAVVTAGSSTLSLYRNIGSAGSISASSFAAKVDFLPGLNPFGVAIGDLDGDAKPEVAVACNGAWTVAVFRNTSTAGSLTSSSLASAVSYSAGNGTRSVAIGDLDGDAKPELVSCNFSSNSLSVFRNQCTVGSISFATKVDFATGDSPWGVVIGDLNGDGKPDLATGNSQSATISTFLNTSVSGSITTSSFAPKSDKNTGSTPLSIAIGDLNADGKPEVVAANYNSDGIAVFQNSPTLLNRPYIAEISASAANPGASLTITGSNFNSTAANNIVRFGATRATVTAAAPTSLTVTVPTGATFAPISVTNAASNLLASYQYPFLPKYDNSMFIAGTSNFEAKVDFATGSAPNAVALADFDGDGKTDIAVVNNTSNTLSVYRNTSSSGSLSSSSFTSKVDFATGSGPIHLAVGDLDMDGKQDIVVANYNSTGSISVFRNTATSGSLTTGSFATKVDYSSGAYPAGVAIADIDGDGRPEIAVTNGETQKLALFRNTMSPGVITSASFGSRVEFATATGSSSATGIATGDVDGDGKIDIVIGNYLNASSVSVFRNTATPGSINSSSLASAVNFTLTAANGSVRLADIDGDGKLDILANHFSGSSFSVLRNTASAGAISSGSFSSAVLFATGGSPRNIEIADVNGDGKADVVIANSSDNTVSVYRNTATAGAITSSSFGSGTAFAAATLPLYVATGDLDGDAKPDIVVANSTSNTISVLRNSPLYLPPTITSITPSIANPGASVTIAGTNFNSTPSNNIIYFGATRATVTAASTTSLTATVPVGATHAPVSVNNTAVGLAGSSQYPFLPTFSNGSGGPVNFAGKVDFTTGNNPFSARLGDIDGDGKPDIVVSNYGSATVSIFRNISSSGALTSSSFAGKVDFATGTQPYGVELADVNGDGKLDVIVANNGSNTMSVLRNISSSGVINSSSLAAKVDFATGNSPVGVAVADFNGDGRADIAVANSSSGTISLFHNNGSAGAITSSSFSTKVDFGGGSGPWDIATGDIDGDGRADVVTTNITSMNFTVFRNTGATGAISASTLSTGIHFANGGRSYGLCLADIDGNGKLDVATTNEENGLLSVFRNTATSGTINSSSFAAKADFATGADSYPFSISAGDFDGDSKVDLAVANSSTNNLAVFRNTSTPGAITSSSLAAGTQFTTAVGPLCVAAGDIDGDGKADLASANYPFHSLSIFRNIILSSIAGSATVCPGGTTTLSNSVSGGTWASSNTTVATVGSATGVVTGLAAGTATISYTLGAGTTTVVVTVNASPTITGTAAACVGATTSLSASGGGTWTSGNTTIATVNASGVVTGVEAGTARINYTATTGCSNSVVVTVNGLSSSAVITSFAGNGSMGYSGNGGAATAASLSRPIAIVRDGAGNIYFSDEGSHTVRKIDPSGNITLVVGSGTAGFSDGTAAAGLLRYPRGIAVDNSGNMYIADENNHRVRKVVLSTRAMTTIAGNGAASFSGDGGAAASAVLNNPRGVAVDGSGNIYIADVGNNRIRKITSGIITTIAGGSTAGYSGDGGAATSALLNGPHYITTDASGNVYFSDYGNSVVRKISTSGIISTVAGTGVAGTAGDGGIATAAQLTNPAGVHVAADGSIYIAEAGTNRVRRVSPTGIITTIAGSGSSGYSGENGFAATAQLASPMGVTTDGSGNVYITDNGNARIRKVSNALPAITGSLLVCEGATTTVANSIGGGTWSSSNIAIATVSAAGVVTGAGGGTTMITYTVSSGCGYANTTSIATVNPLPVVAAITGTANVCPGGTTTLSSTTGGGSWTSSNGAVATVSAAGVATGVATGTATISYSVTNGCGSTVRTMVITVNPLPTAGSITGSSSVCAGSSISLSNTTTGGTWSSSNAAVATVGTSGVVAGVGAGTAVISYFVTNSCGTAVASAIVTVNPLPSAGSISGATSVCAGNTISLSNTTTGGTWSSSNTAVATVGTSGAVAGVGAGTAIISYSVANSCGTAVATATLTVNPLPTAGSIIGSSSVCAGSSISLSNTTTGGTWSSSNTDVATVGTSGVVTGVGAGSAVISYFVTNSCGTSVATTIVTVSPLPTAGSISGATSVCAGNTISLSNTTTGGTWSSSNAAVAAVSSSGVVTGIATGTALISYVVSSECGTAATSVVITVNAVPSAGSIAGASSVCQGAAITLTATASGGSWSSSNTAVATVSAAGAVTGVASGTAVVSYTVSNDCGSSVATKVVTVTGTPSAGSISGAASVFAGSTITLSASVSGGTWSAGNSNATVSSSGIVTGVSVGSVIITYTVSTGCGTALATKAITILSPVADITGPLQVCMGQSITLENATGGGVWTSGNAGKATVGSATGIVTGVSAGTAVISYGVGGSYATAVVTVSAVASAITGTLSACEGAATTLAATTAGGTWSSAGSSVAIIDEDGIVTGIAAGTAVISYTIDGLCARTAVVTINAVPGAITGTPSVCVGAYTTLSNTVSGGTWSVSSPPGVVSISGGGVAGGMTAGTANITYTLPGSCSSWVTVTVSALPAAISGPASVCAGSNITLTNGTTGGTWSSTAPEVATIDDDGIVIGVASGVTQINYITGAGCMAEKNVNVQALPAPITGSPVVCVGGSTSVATTPVGGTWASSNASVATVGAVGAYGYVSGIGAGTATLTYTAPNTCKATIEATVNAVPANISGTAKTCIGSTATLTNTLPGGSWSSDNTAVTTIDETTGVITGIAAGTARITYSVAGGCYKTIIATVNGLPAAISGTATVCSGGTTALSAIGSGTWVSSNTAVATIPISSGVVSGLSAGTATISFTLTATGCTSTRVVTVNAAPASITGTLTVCKGSATTLGNSVAGGSWATANTTIATVGSATGIVNGIGTGSTYVTYSIGSCRTVSIVTVNNSAPITGTAGVCAGSSAALANVVAGGTWSSSAAAVATVGTNGVVNGVSAGNADISYTTAAGCVSIRNVTVNAAPSAIGGTAVVCAGNTVTLTNTVGGGLWSSNATSRATIGSATGIVTGVSGGTAVITYGVAGCAATRIVTVNPINAITGATTICPGATTALSNSSAGGVWSSGNTAIATVGATGIVTGVAAGTANISYTIPSGCSRYVTVTVSAAPATITGALSACAGTLTTLSSTPTGGTWSGSNAAIAIINTYTGVVNGISAGTITVTYSLGGGCRTTAVVTVYPLPAPITGVLNVCEGLVSTLGSATAGGTWSSANTAIATADAATGAITGIATGTATVSYTLSTGCYRAGEFSVKALPPSPAPAAACVSTSTNVYAPDAHGASWMSSTPSVATIGSSTGVLTGVSIGTTTLTYTTVTGCYSTTVATIHPLPSAGSISGPGIVVVGSSVTLSNAATGGVWSSSNATRATVGSATGIVTGVATGSSTISYSVSNAGCTVAATHVVFVTASRSNSQVQSAPTLMQLYPNPTTGAFTVVSEEEGILTVYSIDGKQVAGYSVSAGINHMALPADVAAGVYMCRYTGASGNTVMVRLVYER